MNKNNVLFSILFVASVGLAFATHAQERWSHIGLISDTQANRLCAANVDGGVDFQCYQPNPEILSGGIISATGISASGVISASELWVNGVSITAGGTTINALKDIGDVSATSPAANSLLRYNSGNSKWESAPLQDNLGTTTMQIGWPDAILCSDGVYDLVLYYQYAHSTGVQYARPFDSSAVRSFINFNPSTKAYSLQSGLTGYDCVTSSKSISTLYSEGKAFNFLGNNGAQISLTEIGDVSATAPSNGEALVWNTAQNRWIPGTVAAGAATLASLTDVSATSPAANSLLRYNSGNSKWEAVGLNDGISTTTVEPNWPDLIRCSGSAGEMRLRNSISDSAGKVYYRYGTSASYQVVFNANGSADATAGTSYLNDCVGKSIATLYSEGKAFNFLGNNGAQISLTTIADVSATAPADGEALVWNTAQNRWIPGSAGATAAGSAGQIQFQGASSDLSASNSFTWDNTNDVLGVVGTISSTYIQLPSATTVTTCNSAAAGTMRYSDDSGAMQYCNGSAWANIGVGVPAGTIAAFTTSCPAGWSVLSNSAGRFLRGLDTTGTIDPAGAGRSLGDTQDDALQNITGEMNFASNRSPMSGATPSGAFGGVGWGARVDSGSTSNAYTGVDFDASRIARTSTETRPKNVAVNFCEYTGMGSVAAGGATDGSAGSPSLMFTNDTDTGWWRPAANTMAASTGGTERMRIDSSGNVGIGTTNPQILLHVAGASEGMRIEGSTTGNANAAYMTFRDSSGNRKGYVGDGSTGNADIYLLSDDGNVRANGTGGSCIVNTGGCTSDERLKKDIHPVYERGALVKVAALRGVTYRWKKHPEQTHVGFIAQEVEQTLPELVESGDDGYLTVNYRNMVVPLVEAIKELKAENDALKAQLNAANDNFEGLEQRLQALEANSNVVAEQVCDADSIGKMRVNPATGILQLCNW